MRIVVTGGHHTPALAVIAALREKCQITNYKLQIFWIGHKYSMWGDRNVSAEFREVTARGIPFFDLKAGKFYRTFHPLKWLRLPLGFAQAFYYLLRIRPHLVISFGGYLAVPVVIMGWLLRIPAVTHEQTTVSGLGNRLIGRFARKVFVSWPQSVRFFPEGKTVITGNPIRAAVLKPKTKLQFPRDRRKFEVIYITGGKQGSHVINEAVRGALPKLLKHFNVIHQCGSSAIYDDYSQLLTCGKQLPPGLCAGYLLKGYFGEEEIGAVFAACDFVISRAGANIVYELAALGKPAILIPIPWVSHDEQTKNAKILERVGAAIILPQKDLSPATIIQACMKMKEDLEEYKGNAQTAKKLVRFAAASQITAESWGLLKNQTIVGK